MPVVVTNQGWVKLPPKKNTRPAKPVDPVDVLRGPLAYITGRPDFKQPIKKSSFKQLMIEAATIPVPPPSPRPIVIDELPDLMVKPARSSRTRSQVASEPVSVKSSKQKGRAEVFEEADEEIIRPGIHPQDSQSQRSASPAASRSSRAAPSTRSRRHASSSHTVYDDDQENHRHNRSRRHASASQSVYSEDRQDDYRSRQRSNRSERSYAEPRYRDRSRERDRYYPHPMAQSPYYPHHYASMPPSVQPIVIYSTPAPAVGCGGHHSCHGSHATQPRAVLQIAAPIPSSTPASGPSSTSVSAPRALPQPRPAPSEISSVSTGSTRSKAMSYKWYTATQPLVM